MAVLEQLSLAFTPRMAQEGVKGSTVYRLAQRTGIRYIRPARYLLEGFRLLEDDHTDQSVFA